MSAFTDSSLPKLPKLDPLKRIKTRRNTLVEEIDRLAQDLISAPDEKSKTEIIQRIGVIEAEIKRQLSILNSKALSRPDEQAITATIKSLTSQLESTPVSDKPIVLEQIKQLEGLTQISEIKELAKFMEHWKPVNTLNTLTVDELRRFYYLLERYDRNLQFKLKYEILYTLPSIKHETLTDTEKKKLGNLVQKYEENYKAGALSDDQIDQLLTVSQTLQYKSQSELIIPLQVDILYDRYKSDKERTEKKMTETNHRLFASLLKNEPYRSQEKYRDIRKYYEEERYPERPTPSETFTYTWNKEYLFTGMNRQRTFTSQTDFENFRLLAEKYMKNWGQLTRDAKKALEDTMKKMNMTKTGSSGGGGGDSAVSQPYILRVGYNPDSSDEDPLSELLKFEGTFTYEEAWNLIRVYSDIVLIQYFPYDDPYSFVKDSDMRNDKLTKKLFPKIFPRVTKLQKEIKQQEKLQKQQEELQKLQKELNAFLVERRGSTGGVTKSLFTKLRRGSLPTQTVSLPAPAPAPPLSIHFWRGPARRTTIN